MRIGDVPLVGGKNASIGEMIQSVTSAGVRVPGGFATTVAAYRDFLRANDLDAPIAEAFELLKAERSSLEEVGQSIRESILQAHFPEQLAEEILAAYQQLNQRAGLENVAVAVRSSATAEDLPEASFAGQQETFLNVRGIDTLNDALHQVFASLYNDRAIAYHIHQGFDHER